MPSNLCGEHLPVGLYVGRGSILLVGPLFFPSMPQWLGIQQKRTRVLLSLNNQSKFMICQIKGFPVSSPSIACKQNLYLVKPRLGPSKKFQHLTKAEEVVITRLRIGHTKATKYLILSRGPPTGCHHCGQTLTIDHMPLECALLQECCDEYYTVDSLNATETCTVEFLREAGFFYLI